MVVATQLENLTEREIGYLAGIIDGEGCLTITKTKIKNYVSGFRYIPILFITNTNLEFLQYLKITIGAGSISSKGEKRSNRKPAFNLQLCANALRLLLPLVVDLLKIKKKQAKLMIRFLQLTKGHENYRYRDSEHLNKIKEIYQDIRKLNGMGKS